MAQTGWEPRAGSTRGRRLWWESRGVSVKMGLEMVG